MDHVTHANKAQIDMALAKFFFGCNIPFAVIESSHFKDLLKVLRPAYSAPCRKTLSSTLLDSVSNEMIKMNCNIMPKSSTLLIDGWKNSSKNSKNVVTMLQTTDGKCCFLESFDFSEARETGEALAEVCEKSIELAESRYKTKVYAVVSDNAANMMRMGRLVDIWHSTCNSHTANLLIKDIVDKSTMENVQIVLKEFKHTDLENALIQNLGVRILLTAETRWCSHRDSSNCLLKNLPIMKKLVAEGKKVIVVVKY